MTDYFGSPVYVEIQKRLHQTHADIAKHPGLSNGGRILNVIDIESVGWDQIRAFLKQDRFVGLTAVPLTATMVAVRREIGPETRLPYWQNFYGTPEQVLGRCGDLIDEHELPQGWQISSYACPDDDIIEKIQNLNNATHVAPTPSYYLRSEAVPSLTTCLWDDRGKLVGCANATMRYHPESRLAHTLFAGAVSVFPAHRRKRLGTLINATLLRDSHAAFGWRRVLEQARAENDASCGMIRKCGLKMDPHLVTIIINQSSVEVTR